MNYITEEELKWLIIIGCIVVCMATTLIVLRILCQSRCRRPNSRRCVRDTSFSWEPVGKQPIGTAVVQTPLIRPGVRIVPKTSSSGGDHVIELRYASNAPVNRNRMDGSVQQSSIHAVDEPVDAVPFAVRLTRPVPVQLFKRRSTPSVSSRDSFEEPTSSEFQRQNTSDLRVDVSQKCLAAIGPSPEFLAEDWSTPTQQATVEFSVTYMSSSKAFVICVTRLTNLSVKPRKSSSTISVKIKLVRSPCGSVSPDGAPSTSPSAVVVDSSKHVFDAENGTYFAFNGHQPEDLRQYSLRLFVYEGKYLREKRLAGVEFSLAQLELAPDVPVTCMQKLICAAKDKQKNKKDDKLENAQLMLALFYQTSANRIKVLIRKAANLPKKRRRLGQPEYYVVVNAVSCGRVMATRETKSVPGRSPVWNQPFIFDLPECDVDKYFLQFVVMSDKLCRQDGIVGQVVVGPDIRGSGQTHWHEAFEPRATESVKWHKLRPL